MNKNLKLNGKIIETERLILRSFSAQDLDDFYEYAKVDGVGEMAGWSHHKSIDESRKILNMFISGDADFAICFKENHKVIGSLGLKNYDEKTFPELQNFSGTEIGYTLSKDYWGKGLMPEAVKTVINYLFEDLNLDFILCGYYEFNKQSKRVQEKCGFKFYKDIVYQTRLGTEETGVANIIINPKSELIKII